MKTTLKNLQAEMITWRHYLHQHPETAFNEEETSAYITGILESFGLKVHKGLAQTGIVATLKVGKGKKSIGLRADIDALDILEKNDIAYKSLNEGKMHACGHDGHTAMLLGAAKFLQKTQEFDGTVYFIFQPAEENKAGGQKMIEDGLFELFPMDSIYGMHNIPGIPTGNFAIKSGPIMASMDTFEIHIAGKGGHAAQPHLVNDPFIMVSHVINALQSIISRNVNPVESAVLSITQIHGGDTWNIIPASVILRGTIRSFKQETAELIKAKMQSLLTSTGKVFSAEIKIIFNPENPAYPATINSTKETTIAVSVSKQITGENRVDINPLPRMISEDFAFMLQKKPGCYIWIGNGAVEKYGDLHTPNYNFNDEILPTGAAYWVTLVEKVLAKNKN